MSDYKKILFRRDGAISTITFNRPDAHKGLDKEMSDKFQDAAPRSANSIAAYGPGPTPASSTTRGPLTGAVPLGSTAPFP